MNNAPAFQMYPGDWLGSQRVQMLTLEEEGAYIRLLCYCWRNGSIPADHDQLLRLLGKGGSTTLVTTVATMFQPHPTDETRLVHDRLDSERAKQEAWREKSAKGGLNSAKSRKNGKGGSRVVEGWLNNGDKGGSSKEQPPYEPNANQQPTLLSSTSVEVEVQKKRKEVKAKASSADECEEYARSIGASRGQGEAWFWKMEGCGWLNGGKPVKNWKATIMAWHKQGYLPVVVNDAPWERELSQDDTPSDESPPADLSLLPKDSPAFRVMAGLRGHQLFDPDEIVYCEQPVD